MARITVDVQISRNLVSQVTSETRNTVRKAVRTIAQDLARTASESAPHKTGDLESSYTVQYQMSGDQLTATVEFAVFHGGFNYAIAMHEWTYKLGAGSQAKSGGTGMSGTTYAVGRKFLTRPLEGEAETYRQYILSQILQQLMGG
jgi:hypothetical protein